MNHIRAARALDALRVADMSWQPDAMLVCGPQAGSLAWQGLLMSVLQLLCAAPHLQCLYTTMGDT